MIKYKCIVACPYKSKNYKEGDIESFEEPMNPRVWVPLEGEPIPFADFVEYCRAKRHGGDPETEEETENVRGEVSDGDALDTDDKPIIDEAVRYEVSREGNRYKVSKFIGESTVGEIIKKDLLKSDAEELAEELSKTDED